jgi:transposase
MIKRLKSNEKQQLEAGYRSVVDKRTASKINIILLLDDGYTHSEVAAILRLDDSTIRRNEKSFVDNGIEEYISNSYNGSVCKLSLVQLQELENHLDEHLCENTDEVIRFIKENFDISYTRGGTSALLRRLGFVFKRTTLIPGKSDAEVQIAFVEYYKQLRKSMGANDKLYFVDGVHPQHNSQAGLGWIRKGKKKELQSNTGRQRVNLNGALDIETHELIIRSDDSLNAQSTINLFRMIEEENPTARKIVLIVDNALYYYNRDVVEFINNSSQLEVVYLPPYSQT